MTRALRTWKLRDYGERKKKGIRSSGEDAGEGFERVWEKIRRGRADMGIWSGFS